MSTLDVRNNSAMMKRAEQLKRWEESDTNRAPATPRTENGRRIKFSSGCVFLAACLSSDKDEVLLLLSQGADINTANVDGLTGLHQACIDDNLEMVEFLVEHGADINRQDNEGWTPLHATASCGFVSIARYLVESGADVAAVNSDGDLALDLAIDTQHVPMIDYMSKVVQELNIDVEQARKAEEMAMLNDAKKWLRSDASEVDRPHPKTGATAMHVAAAKGYTKVLSLLLAGRANVDKQDNDGWTPLHGAAHWGQKETAEMLIESLADMDIRNYAGQTCIDIADRKMVKFLEELRANKRNKRRPSSQISRISDTIENHVDKTPTKIVRVEVRTDNTKDADNMKSNANNLQQQLYTNTDQQTVEDEAPWRRKTPRTQNDSLTKNQVPDKEVGNKTTTTTATTNTNAETNDVILRRTQSFENDQKKPPATPVNTTPPASITTTTTTTSGTNTPTSATNNAPTVAGVIPPIRRSFVPPVRDEESETQRKAHAKRVRETRRSTQGVTLDEIKSAEELVKKKNLGMNNNNNNNNNSNNETQDTTTSTTTTTIDTTTTSTQEQLEPQEPPPPPTSPPPSLIPEESTEIIETITKTATTPTSAEDDKIHTEIIKEDDIVTEILSDLADVDATATFTIAAPPVAKKRGSIQIADSTDEQKQEEQERELERVAAVETSEQSDDDAGMVSASYTIKAVRRGSVKITEPEKEVASESTAATVSKDNAEDNDHKADDEKQVKDENEKTDDVNDNDDNDDVANNETKINSPTATPTSAETLEVYQRPTELECTSSGLSIASYTPNSMPTSNSSSSLTSGHSTDAIIAPPIESPVRLRDKRALFVPLPPPGGVDSSESKYFGAGDVKTTSAATSTASTPTSASALSELNPRDSLINCYANLAINSRRSLDSVGVLQTTTTTSAAAAAVGGDATTTTTTSMAQREAGGAGGNTSISLAERRPSWRLKFDAGSKFKLEDVTSGVTFPAPNSTIIPSAPAVLAAANLTGSQRRISASNNSINASNQSLNSIGRPVSAPANETTTTTAYLTHARKYEASAAPTTPAVTSASSSTSLSSNSITSTPATTTSSSSSTITSASTTAADDKDNDKENDNRSAHMAIQRRRKPKRRSTGVVHIDMDEIDPDRHESSSANDNEDKEKESGSERTTRSRLGSTASNNAASNEISKAANNSSSSNKTENGDGIDYKALWEAAKLENDKLKQMLKQKDDEVVQTRATLERFTNATTKNSLSELEKRERRAMERKLSEMEEELKLLQKLKTENERLRAENRALTRVVSKLTTSAQSQLAKSK